MANEISHIKGPDDTSYDIKDATARSDISNLATVASTGEYSDLLHPPTVAEIDDNSTANNKAWSASKINTRLNDPVTFITDDIPEGSANLSATATTHRITAYRNGLSIPYRGDNTNDGGILRVRGKSESDCILELGTWDDSGSGETIQFNYYPTTSQVTPTYSVTVPKKSGTIALAGDVVAKNGDTMTGALTMSNVNTNVKDTDVKVGTAPSSTIYGNGYYCQSNNGGDLFYVRATQDTSDNVGMQIEVRRAIGSSTYYNTVRLGISNNGTKTVGVSDAGVWRSAIGAQATLSNSDLSYTRVNGNVSNDAKCRRYGNIVEFTGQFGLSSSSLARDTILWNGFPKPKTVVYFTARCEGNWNTYSFYISTNGEIKNQQASIPSGTYNCNLVYICQ